MQDWLVDLVGSDLAPIVSVLLSALIVVVLAVVVISVLRRLMRRGIGFGSSPGPRVEVMDVTAIDPKRKLVLVRRDGVEHLLLIGGANDLVVEARIGRPAPPPPVGTRPDMEPEMVRQPARAPEAPPAPVPTRPIPVAQAPAVESARRPVGPNPAPAVSPVAPSVAPSVRVEPAFGADNAPSTPVPAPTSAAPAIESHPAPVQPMPRATPVPSIQAETRNAGGAVPTIEPASRGPVAVTPPSVALPPEQRSAPARIEPAFGEAPSLGRTKGEPIRPPDRDDASAISSERRAPDMARPQKPQRPDERGPLTVRSFASAIGDRDRQKPAPGPAVAAPPVAAEPSRATGPAAERSPEPRSIAPAAPIASAPQADTAEDDLARMLSLEFETETETERVEVRQAAMRGEPRSAAAPAEISIEEEMERLMREFSARANDRS